jgi:hypothetical protein
MCCGKRAAAQVQKRKETLIKWLRRRIAALRGARNPHVPGRTFRFLCAARLALHPPRSLHQRFLKRIKGFYLYVESTTRRLDCFLRAAAFC